MEAQEAPQAQRCTEDARRFKRIGLAPSAGPRRLSVSSVPPWCISQARGGSSGQRLSGSRYDTSSTRARGTSWSG